MGHIEIFGFILVHWMFSSHYLKVACLFQLTFKGHSEDLLEKMKRRRCLLFALDIVMYSYVTFISIAGHFFDAQITLGALWVAYMWIAALCQVFAMKHIQEC